MSCCAAVVDVLVDIEVVYVVDAVDTDVVFDVVINEVDAAITIVVLDAVDAVVVDVSEDDVVLFYFFWFMKVSRESSNAFMKVVWWMGDGVPVYFEVYV